MDAELEQQLKEVGEQLARPSDSVDELIRVLDHVEKLLLKVDQSPKKSMLDALKPSMNALIQDGLLKHSDTDVKVSVASCISEITRITAPDAPYTDDQMRDVFQLTVFSFEDVADQSSQSYNKRASVLDTVSKVRSCVIMLDLECDELIVKMFELFLKSVRDYHLDSSNSIFTSMENIMLLVIEESEDISVELLKALLASVKKHREGVLPVAHKLGKTVLLKSADKLKPYMIPVLKSLGESLDMYHKVVAAVCEGTTANFENNDDNDSGLQLSIQANECKLEKGTVDEAHQANESKVTTASSDHVDQVGKEEACPEEEVDPTLENKSPKSVVSNGVNVTDKEDKSQEPLSKEDTDDSDADMLVKIKSKTLKTSKENEKKADTVMNSAEPSDASHVEDDKEIEKDNDVKESENENERDNDVKEPENQNEKDNDVKESENEAAIPSETEKDKETVEELSPKAIESKPVATANVSSPCQINSVSDGSSVRSKQKPVPQEDETVSPSKTGSLPDETREDTPESQTQTGKKTVISKEVKLPDTVHKSEDGKAGSGSDAELLKKSSESTKQKLPDTVKKAAEGEPSSGSDAELLKKSSKSTKQKLPDTVKKCEDGDASSGSDAKLLKNSSKSAKQKLTDTVKKSEVIEASRGSDAELLKKSSKSTKQKLRDTVKNSKDGEDRSDSDAELLKESPQSIKQSQNKSKQSGKKLDVAESDAKKSKLSGKKVDVKGKESGSGAKPLKRSGKKGEKSKIAVEEEEESDDGKLLKLSAIKTHSKKKVDVKGEEEESDDGKLLKLSVIKTTSKKKVDVKGEEGCSDAKPLKMSVKKGEKSKIAVKEEEESDDGKTLKLSAIKTTSKKKDDGKKRENGKNVVETDQAKSLSGDDEMDISPKSATKSAKGVGNSTETPATSAKRKRSTGKKLKDIFSNSKDAIKYDESLIGTRVKVWWPEDKMYYEGVVAEYYPAKKKHRISYMDGDEEILVLESQRWEILRDFSTQDDEEQRTEAQNEEASPDIPKKKSKTDPVASQEKIKDSDKRIGGVSLTGKSKGATTKGNKSSQKTSSKSSDATATTSKETGRSIEDEETLKTSRKTKTINKLKGQTPTSGSKSNINASTKAKSGLSNAKEPEDVKSTENTKGGSKSGNKRKQRT